MGVVLLHTFTNIPGSGIRTASFAAFGAWSETLLKNAESLRSSDALMRVAVPRRRGPAGLRDLFVSVEIVACMPCAQNFLSVRSRGVSLPSAYFACCRNAGWPLTKRSHLPFSEVRWA